MRIADVTQELNHPGALELLHSGALARLAYTGRDGDVRVIPVGFHWNGEQIVVCNAPSAPKVRALSSRPRVALTIDTDAAPAKALLVRGVVTLEIVGGVPLEYIAASAKSTDSAQLHQFETHVRAV
jgi:hypothetical protein